MLWVSLTVNPQSGTHFSGTMTDVVGGEGTISMVEKKAKGGDDRGENGGRREKKSEKSVDLYLAALRFVPFLFDRRRTADGFLILSSRLVSSRDSRTNY